MPDRPVSLLVIQTDEQRWDTLGCTGHPLVRTPHVDALAARGATFDNAFTVSPVCVPSRTSFFTGDYPHRNRAAYNDDADHLDVDQCDLLRGLRDAGYRLGLAGKNHTFREPVFDELFDYREQTSHWGKEHGTLTNADRRVAEYLRHDPRPECARDFAMLEGLIPGPMPFAEHEAPTHRIGDDAVRFVETLGADEPFCLLTMFGDPHWPNVAPEPWYSMIDPADVTIEADGHDFAGQPFRYLLQSRACGWDRYSADDKRRILATYLGQVAFCDAQVGRVVAALDVAGRLDDTLILFTSDHGAFAGRFGLVGKTHGYNDALVRIPAVLAGPGVPAGVRVDEQLSNIDLFPTMLDLAGIEPAKPTQGRSMKGLLDGSAGWGAGREAVFAEMGEAGEPLPAVPREELDAHAAERAAADGTFWFAEHMRRGRSAMVRAGGWKYVHYVGDTAELYDLTSDPLELNNLADAEPAKRREMHARLTDWLLHQPWLP